MFNYKNAKTFYQTYFYHGLQPRYKIKDPHLSNYCNLIPLQLTQTFVV